MSNYVDFGAAFSSPTPPAQAAKPPEKPSQNSSAGHGSGAASALAQGVHTVSDDEWVDTLRSILDRDPLGYCAFSQTWAALEYRFNKSYGFECWQLISELDESSFQDLLQKRGMKLHLESDCLSLSGKSSRPRLAEARRLEYARKRGIILPKKFPKTQVARLRILDEIGV